MANFTETPIITRCLYVINEKMKNAVLNLERAKPK